MRTFTDTAGRTWTLQLNLGTAKRVRDVLNVDLLQPEQGDPPLLTRLGTDELLLGEVICCLLADQFEARKVTDADIRAGFDGATLLAAQKAFYEEIEDFFRQRGRLDRARAVATQSRMIDAAVKAVDAKLASVDIDQAIAKAMTDASEAKTAGRPSGNSPEASESIPAD